MPFNIGDARDLTNWKSTCSIMKETMDRYNVKDFSKYNIVLSKNSNEIIQRERKEVSDRINMFINNTIGKR